MYIRALMTKEKIILIKMPLSIIDKWKNIASVIDKVSNISTTKEIVILDTIHNEIHYRGSLCNIVK